MFYNDSQDHVIYFGEWAEDNAKGRLVRHALAILHDAAARCDEQDMRLPELDAALDFLRSRMSKPILCRRFRLALDVPDSEQRQNVAQEALRLIVQAVGGQS